MRRPERQTDETSEDDDGLRFLRGLINGTAFDLVLFGLPLLCVMAWALHVKGGF